MMFCDNNSEKIPEISWYHLIHTRPCKKNLKTFYVLHFMILTIVYLKMTHLSENMSQLQVLQIKFCLYRSYVDVNTLKNVTLMRHYTHSVMQYINIFENSNITVKNMQ
jgi:hypothetical protein